MPLIQRQDTLAFMNESCHVWMSHVTYQWVMSHMIHSRKMPLIRDMTHSQTRVYLASWHDSFINASVWMPLIQRQDTLASCRISMSHVTYVWMRGKIHSRLWMSHVTCGWVMLRINESCHRLMSHVTYQCDMTHWCEWVMLRSDESCRICMHERYAWHDMYEDMRWVVRHLWVMAHWMSHGSLNESWLIEWVMTHWMSDGDSYSSNESCTSHISWWWLLTLTCLKTWNESCRICMNERYGLHDMYQDMRCVKTWNEYCVTCECHLWMRVVIVGQST